MHSSTPATWAALLTLYAGFLRAAGRRPLTIRQHLWHVTSFARAVEVEPSAVTDRSGRPGSTRTRGKPAQNRGIQPESEGFFVKRERNETGRGLEAASPGEKTRVTCDSPAGTLRQVTQMCHLNPT